MILSMTGFGKAEYSQNGSSIAVEVYSLNGRFLDVRTKLPRALFPYESELRKIAQEYIKRGKVTITVNVAKESARADAMEIDFKLADKYVGMSREIAERYGLDSAIDVRTLMTLPEIFTGNENGEENGGLWDKAEKTIREALEAHRAMRCEEGATLGSDIRERLLTIDDCLNRIKNRAGDIAEVNRQRLRKKIESLLGSDTFDEIRFAMDIALYAERVDVTEECVRFRSHIEQFSHELDNETTSGKKLLFLLQEMNREANTIGSKTMDTECTQTVILIKEELEKIREQAENTE